MRLREKGKMKKGEREERNHQSETTPGPFLDFLLPRVFSFSLSISLILLSLREILSLSLLAVQHHVLNASHQMQAQIVENFNELPLFSFLISIREALSASLGARNVTKGTTGQRARRANLSQE